MRAETVEFDRIRYNPACEGYEARVRVTDNGQAVDYAVAVKAPMTAEYTFVARQLREAALSAHLRARGAMRLRSRAASAPAMAA